MTPTECPKSRMTRHDCFSCDGGQDAAHIVTFPYEGVGDGPGRILLYCDSCAKHERLTTRLPIRLLEEDPEVTLEFLYGHQLTLTDPEMGLLHGEVTGWVTRPWWAASFPP